MNGLNTDEFEAWLISHHAFAATLHQVKNEQLHLLYHYHIPTDIIDKIKVIDKGIGMAGLAFEQATQISTCPLARDEFQRLKPHVQFIEGKGTSAIPIWILNNHCYELWGILGIALSTQIDTIMSEQLSLECAQLITR